MKHISQVAKRVSLRAQRHWLTIAFVFGFIGDLILLNKVDDIIDNAILLFYVSLATASIFLLYAGIAEKFSEKTNLFFRTWSPYAMQYAFGGLLSGMLIFYGRSGTFVESWPYLLMIAIVIYGNETITNRQTRLVYNLIIYFIGLISYVVLVIPVLTGKMGPTVFVGSGLLALLIMYNVFRAVERIVPNFIQLQKRNVVFIIGTIYVVFNVLYFTNIIPPIPLSIKHAGMYYDVVRIDDTYTLTYEQPPWWLWYRNSSNVLSVERGDAIYCYASVFAPTRLSTDIFHRWEYYDESTKKWVQHARIAYAIRGGREKGYRGYTLIRNHFEGTWRCRVETGRGQVVGMQKFEIIYGKPGELVTRQE